MIDWRSAGYGTGSRWERAAIQTDRHTATLRDRALRVLPLVGLVFAVALIGGGVGAYLGVRLVDQPQAVAQATPTRTPTPTPTEAERLRRAIDRVFPAVVTVLADLPPEALEDGRIRESQNIGSGIVIHDDGTVITNYHVVEGAAEIMVVLATGEEREAVFVADDSPFQDLAILRIRGGGLRSAALGPSSALRPGDTVIAISGGLIDFQNQVKVGVVSSLGVNLPRTGFILEDLIQTDAAVNQGDSGGALVDLDGRVVGVLTTVVRTAGGRHIEGAAFAQPADRLLPVVEAVRATGSNPRPRIGIERVGQHHVILTSQLAAELDAPIDRGAAVLEVEPGSPAAEAGIRPGDIVLGVNGTAVTTSVPLVNLLGAVTAGDDVELAIMRGSSQHIITVSPRPAN